MIDTNIVYETIKEINGLKYFYEGLFPGLVQAMRHKLAEYKEEDLEESVRLGINKYFGI